MEGQPGPGVEPIRTWFRARSFQRPTHKEVRMLHVALTYQQALHGYVLYVRQSIWDVYRTHVRTRTRNRSFLINL